MDSKKENTPATPPADAAGGEMMPDELKRDFLRRFGKYAATTPAAVFVLMSTHSSRAVGASDGAPY